MWPCWVFCGLFAAIIGAELGIFLSPPPPLTLLIGADVVALLVHPTIQALINVHTAMRLKVLIGLPVLIFPPLRQSQNLSFFRWHPAKCGLRADWHKISR